MTFACPPLLIGGAGTSAVNRVGNGKASAAQVEAMHKGLLQEAERGGEPGQRAREFAARNERDDVRERFESVMHRQLAGKARGEMR